MQYSIKITFFHCKFCEIKDLEKFLSKRSQNLSNISNIYNKPITNTQVQHKKKFTIQIIRCKI